MSAGPCKEPLFNKCCILGLGLMGGSLGLALGEHKVVRERWGYDHDTAAMLQAEKRGAVDRTAELSHALSDAELVVLAMPVRQILRTLEMLEMLGRDGSCLPKGAIVTDLGSTKEQVVQTMEAVLPAGVTGIGGHPMAGSEKAGIGAADPMLLNNAVYVLTPAWQANAAALEKMRQTVCAIGARPLVMEAAQHDRMAALVSHLPQLAAVALVNSLGNGGQTQEALEALLRLAGSGFRDTTRIAMSEPGMWYDIFQTNKLFIKESLQNFMKELDLIYNCLEREDEKEVKARLSRAASTRRVLTELSRSEG